MMWAQQQQAGSLQASRESAYVGIALFVMSVPSPLGRLRRTSWTGPLRNFGLCDERMQCAERSGLRKHSGRRLQPCQRR
jgi:hypothetical protein